MLPDNQPLSLQPSLSVGHLRAFRKFQWLLQKCLASSLPKPLQKKASELASYGLLQLPQPFLLPIGLSSDNFESCVQQFEEFRKQLGTLLLQPVYQEGAVVMSGIVVKEFLAEMEIVWKSAKHLLKDRMQTAQYLSRMISTYLN